jgi:pimeloyl-ACP methyl ester carboxylesterase
VAAPPPGLPHLPPARIARLRRLFRLLRALSPDLAARVALDRLLRPTRRVLEAVDRPLLDQARRSQLHVDRRPLRVYHWGDAGPLLLLVHGWGSHAPRFSAFVAAALARGWQVVAFDAPAHGASPGRTADVTAFARAIDAVAESAHIDYVIAHSLGALATASRLAAATPRFAPTAAVLVSLPEDVAGLFDAYFALLGADDDFRRRVLAAYARRAGPDAAALQAHALAPRIPCPVLLVHDRDDAIVPFAHAEGLAPRLRGGRLLATRGLGHRELLRDPAVVTAALDFLAAASC